MSGGRMMKAYLYRSLATHNVVAVQRVGATTRAENVKISANVTVILHITGQHSV